MMTNGKGKVQSSGQEIMGNQIELISLDDDEEVGP